MSNKTRFFENTLFASVSIYAEYLIGMITSILMARSLGPDQFGLYSYVIWFAGLGIVLASGAVNQGAVKFIAESRGEGDPKKVIAVVNYLQTIMWWLLLTVVVLGSAAILLAGAHLTDGATKLWLLVPLLAMAIRTQYMFYISVAKGFEDYKATAKVAGLASPIHLVMTMLAAWLAPTFHIFLVVYLVSGCVFFAISAYLVRPRLASEDPVSLDADTRARIRRHVRIVSGTVILGFLASAQVEVFFLGSIASFSELANFRVAHRLASGLALLVPGVFSAVMLPMMARSVGEGGGALNRRILGTKRYILLLAAPLVVFCCFFSADLVVGLFGTDYAGATWPFSFLLVASALGAWATTSNTALVSVDRQQLILIIVSCTALLKVALGYVLVSKFGLAGAVAAYFLVSILHSCAMILTARQVLSLRLELGAYCKTIATALAPILACLPCLLWMPSGIGRAALCAAIYGILFGILVLVTRLLPPSDIQFFDELRQRYLLRIPGLGPLMAYAQGPKR